jgi:hypothetical protein
MAQKTKTMSGRIINAVVSNKPLSEESLRVNLNKQRIKLGARLLKYRDRDTRQIIFFIPSLQITGYGATEEKAKEMLDFSIDEYFLYLVSLSQKKLDEELMRLGWNHVAYANKEFSKVFVSSDGELENFNAVADDIEHLTVQV